MAIYCNQTGYLPQSRKTAVMTGGKMFRLIQKTDTGEHTVMEDFGTEKGWDKASGDTVTVADFSRIQQEGIYYLENDAGETSHSFRIGNDVYKSLHRDLMKALYYQRCGCALEEKYAGVYTHSCCHTDDAVFWENHAVRKQVTGGWHDAGDYGRYISAAAVTLGHLLHAYRLFPDSFNDSLNIPESGNGTPDILNECRYELEWMLKMQDTEGGVYHKLTSRYHAPFIMPEEDKAQFYIFPVSSLATADFTAAMALASRIYRLYDKAFADRLLLAAKAADHWLEKHPEFIGFENPKDCNTGEYKDNCDLDERLWAAAEMLVTTKEQKYQDKITELIHRILVQADLSKNKQDLSNHIIPRHFAEFGWENVSGLASLALLTDPADTADAQTVSVLRSAVLKEADRLVRIAEDSGYGIAMEAEDFIWGSNMVVMNRGILLILADILTKQDGNHPAGSQYEETALSQLHYLLGKNAVDYSYVTGHGERAYRHPHNRVTESDNIELPMPGWVSGGPFKTPLDEVGMKRIKPGTPPMKCYIDHAACYSLNEITIYWNSPAIFVTAYFNR